MRGNEIRRQTDARHCFNTESSVPGQYTSPLKYALCFSTSIFLDITQVSYKSMTTRSQMRLPRKSSKGTAPLSVFEKHRRKIPKIPKGLLCYFSFKKKIKGFYLKAKIRSRTVVISIFNMNRLLFVLLFLIVFLRWGQSGEETAGGQPGRRQGGRVSP